MQGKIPEYWQYWTWREYWNDCIKFAKSLAYLKVESYHIINILGFNAVSDCTISHGILMIRKFLSPNGLLPIPVPFSLDA